MTESEKRAHRVCFTWHRPEKLIRSEKAIKMDLEREIRLRLTRSQSYVLFVSKQVNAFNKSKLFLLLYVHFCGRILSNRVAWYFNEYSKTESGK